MFKTPCFIRKNTPELRKKLEDIGYYSHPSSGSSKESHGSYLCCNHGFYSNLPIGYSEEVEMYVDCGENEELFLAISALRDDSDTMQFFRITDLSTGNIIDKCVRLTYGKRVSKSRFGLHKYHDYLIEKLSPQELIEYFKTLKK